MKKILQIITEFLSIFRRVFSAINKKKNEKEIKDVKEAVEDTDLDKLRDSVLGRK